MNNTSGIEFKDIASEEFRCYEFLNGSTITIKEPLSLNVSSSGGHRVLSKDGISHYIPSGWIHLYWKAKQGQANFCL